MLALDRGDVRAARDYFDRAHRARAGSSKAHAGAGAAAFQGGDRKAGDEAWARAVELDPQNLDALYASASTWRATAGCAEARPYLERFLRAARRRPRRRDQGGLAAAAVFWR